MPRAPSVKRENGRTGVKFRGGNGGQSSLLASPPSHQPRPPSLSVASALRHDGIAKELQKLNQARKSFSPIAEEERSLLPYKPSLDGIMEGKLNKDLVQGHKSLRGKCGQKSSIERLQSVEDSDNVIDPYHPHPPHNPLLREGESDEVGDGKTLGIKEKEEGERLEEFGRSKSLRSRGETSIPIKTIKTAPPPLHHEENIKTVVKSSPPVVREEGKRSLRSKRQEGFIYDDKFLSSSVPFTAPVPKTSKASSSSSSLNSSKSSMATSTCKQKDGLKPSRSKQQAQDETEYAKRVIMFWSEAEKGLLPLEEADKKYLAELGKKSRRAWVQLLEVIRYTFLKPLIMSYVLHIRRNISQLGGHQ